ncbi:MAG: choice-of-anchor J domain-containing protein [Bacteroidota bacterium]
MGNDFIAEYGPAGFTPGTGATANGGIIATGTSSPISLPGLASATTYNVYVRQVCSGPSYSANSIVAAFTTNCDPFVPAYSQNFTTYLPVCWKQQTGTLTTIPTALTGTSSLWDEQDWLNSTSNNAAVINLYSTDKHEWLISPTINLGGAGNYQLEFDLATLEFFDVVPSAIGSDDSLAVVISTDNGATWSTTNILGLWTAANTPVSASGVHITIPLTAYTGLVKIGFYATDGTVNNPEDVDVMIDNFAINVQPACLAPTAVSVGSVTSTTASVSFTSAGASFVAEYGPVGFTPGTGASPGVNGLIQTGTASPVGLTGLTVGTTYEVYVRRNCGPDGYSTNTGPVLFSTVCSATNIPYIETFDGATVPNVPTCIIVENTGNTAKTWETHGILGIQPDLPVSYPNFIRLDYDPNGITPADDWFFTRGLNLTGGVSYRLRFNYRNSDAEDYIEKLEVKYGTGANAAAMTAGTLFSNTNIDFNEWQDASVIDFTPSISGVYYIGFMVSLMLIRHSYASIISMLY